MISASEYVCAKRILQNTINPDVAKAAEDIIAQYEDQKAVAIIECAGRPTKVTWNCGCQSDAEGNRYYYLCGKHRDEIGVSE